jgi:predicted DNA-binding protein
MSEAAPIISFRLPKQHLTRLDALSALTRRSRSFLVKDAVARYIDEVMPEGSTHEAPKRRLTRLLALAGSGASSDHVRSSEEIDAHMRWLRGDE